FEIDHNAGGVVRREGGKVRWATPLTGDLGRVRPQHALWDAKRVYVSQSNGVTALAAATGVVVWHSEGPSAHLLLSGDLLLAAQGPLVLARPVTTATEAFKPRAPA